MNLNARDILAKTLQAEAGNQGAVGMLSVGSVIMNRMMDPNYANSLHDVILQPGQFSVWNKTTGYADGEQGVDVANLQASDTAYSVADQLLDQNYNDPTKGATHFYNPNISNPSWGKSGGGNWQTIGDHIFGKPQEKGKKSMVAPLNTSSLLQPKLTNNAVNNSLLSTQPGPNNVSNKKGLFGLIGNTVGGGFDKFKQAVTGEDAEASDRLALAMMSLSGNPDGLRPLMEMAAQDIQDNKAQKKLDKQKNATLEFLTSKAKAGDAKAQQALELVGATGAAGAMQQYLQSTTSNSANKTEAETKMYDSGYTVQQFQDGSTKHFLDGQIITDPAAIKKAREDAIAYDLRQESLKIQLEANSKIRADKNDQVVQNIGTTAQNLTYFSEALDALYQAKADGKPITGVIRQYLPNISKAANQLREAQTRLGLAVIGGTTFGALSKDEMTLAMNTDIDQGLPQDVLIEELERKMLAQTKVMKTLRQINTDLMNPELTASEAMDKYLAQYDELKYQNPYSGMPEAELINLYNAIKSGEYVNNPNMRNMRDPQARQYIINEVERRAKQ